MCMCVCLSVCVCKYFKLPTFPPFCLIIHLRTTFQIAHLSPILLDHTSAYDISNCPPFPHSPWSYICVYDISNCPPFPHSAWSYICVRHFKLPTFPRLTGKRKKDGENMGVRACVCIQEFQVVHISPTSLDTTGFSRIASCPHSSWTLSALASTLSCPFLPSKLGHKCACAALEVVRSSQFMLCHTFLRMHAEWNCPERRQCTQRTRMQKIRPTVSWPHPQ